LITKPVSHTRKLDNWRAVFTLEAHLPTPQLLSLSVSLLALFSLRCAQRWRLLYTTFVSPDFQFVCRNLSIWCFSPSDCWNFGPGFLFSAAKNWLLSAPESPLVTSSFWDDDGGGSIAWLPHSGFFLFGCNGETSFRGFNCRVFVNKGSGGGRKQLLLRHGSCDNFGYFVY
jgi:hypothetical protein